MNTQRSDKAWEAFRKSSNAQHIRSESCRLETELAEVKEQWRMSSVCRELRDDNDKPKAKLEKCRTALDGISEYGKMCKSTDAVRMKYFADQALDQTK